uniref:WD repeat and FYVE domain-containing protein 3-like isoform X3 n=1 Tax=Petromyzon marinus TaxID=7757 RepID=A0AAJ7WPX8_PETMA|nr:WD repeat and FYVE domain-containing protein 3-like isoform X3 [Petromyzon marinus]
MSFVFRRIMSGGRQRSEEGQQAPANGSAAGATPPAQPHSEQASPESSPSCPGLRELRRLAAELCQAGRPPTASSPRDQEEKLYKALPLFNKVFEGVPPHQVCERFPSLLQFTSQVSRLAVSEIRRRAANKSTEAASRAIVEFLEDTIGEDDNPGWRLLTTINLLSGTGQKTVDCMTTMSLPSTLVKCLYLFFDLPPASRWEGDPRPDPVALEKRVNLQTLFVQILVRLCRYPSPAEELVQKDDLALLFGAATSWCPPHNLAWRRSAGDVLRAVSRHGLTNNVIRYLHEKQCVARCVHTALKTPDLSAAEAGEMLVWLVCFLRDSSEASPILMDDFADCHGYQGLTDFLLRLEDCEGEECSDTLRDLIMLVASLTTCGATELRATTGGSARAFVLPGFILPQPSGRGLSVRNVQAFSVLQSAFVRSHGEQLARATLDAMASVYMSDRANYFILASQGPGGGNGGGNGGTGGKGHEASAALHGKPAAAQARYFEILDYVVFQLRHAPRAELAGVAASLRANAGGPSPGPLGAAAAAALLRFARHAPPIFREVYREAGLLEALVGGLHHYAAFLKNAEEREAAGGDRIVDGPVKEWSEYACLVLETLTIILQGSNTNSDVFRECGGARSVHAVLRHPAARTRALALEQQLLLSARGEEEMISMLSLANSLATASQLRLRADILAALLGVLRESHRSRRAFRRVGGFVYLLSMLVSMESSLSAGQCNRETPERTAEVVELTRTTLHALTAAMRCEPANAHYFLTEIGYEKLADALRFLGCFAQTRELNPAPAPACTPEQVSLFAELMEADSEDGVVGGSCPPTLVHCGRVFSHLYKMATDSFDRMSVLEAWADGEGTVLPSPWASPSPPRTRRALYGMPCRPMSNDWQATGFFQASPDPAFLVHPGAVLAAVDLLPSVVSTTDPQRAVALQCAVVDRLGLLLQSERSQQVLSEAGLARRLLLRCCGALASEAHPLHDGLQRAFERLACHGLEPPVLRAFLRLGNPLNCAAWDERDLLTHHVHRGLDVCHDPTSLDPSVPGRPPENCRISRSLLRPAEGAALPLTRIKCLVAMTTPLHTRHNMAAVPPPFLEFDMSVEGFGCLFLPSLAPQNAPGGSSVAISPTDDSVTSGMGSGERVFPPPSGLSYSVWLCVERLDSPSQAHPVRLLTLVRRSTGSDRHLACLALSLLPRDKAVLLCTREQLLQEMDDSSQDGCVRFVTPELAQEGQWHHLVLVLNRGVLKPSSASLYVDGQLAGNTKLSYIQATPGGLGSAGGPGAPPLVYGYVGTPPGRRRSSPLAWRVGPVHLMEEPLGHAAVATIFGLGVHHTGCMQAVLQRATEGKSEPSGSATVSLVPEERLSFGLYPLSASLLTVAKIRKAYNKADSRAVAKQIGLSSNENVTPVMLLHNASGHLGGPSRTIGAAVIGNLGVRRSAARPVASSLQCVGGPALLLGLLAMAGDVEALYAATKALVCAVRASELAQREMERIRGYQLLAMLLKRKRSLLNTHSLHLALSLAGTVESGRERDSLSGLCLPAFRDLVTDLQIWFHSPYDLHLSLLDHFVDLLTESSDVEELRRIMLGLQLVPKLLHVLKDHTLPLSKATVMSIARLLSLLLQGFPSSHDMLWYGQFLASTLPTFSVSEKFVELRADEPQDDDALIDIESMEEDGAGLVSARNIFLRNQLLEVLLDLLHTSAEKEFLSQPACEEMLRILGFDWLLLFVQGHLHPATVTVAMRILVSLLSNGGILRRFQEGSPGGGWLDLTQALVSGQTPTVLGFNVGRGPGGGVIPREINSEACLLPGFSVLLSCLPSHASLPQLYFFLLALFLNRPITSVPENVQLDLDSIWRYSLGLPPSVFSAPPSVPAPCLEAVLTLLAMLRSTVNQPWQAEEEGSWLIEYPVTQLQFLQYLYHNVGGLANVWTHPEFLGSLAATIFPYNLRPHSEMVGDVEDSEGPEDESGVFTSEAPMGLNRSRSEQMVSARSSFLSQHPSRKLVVDFLRTIAVDSLLQGNVSRQSPPLLDVLLEASPERATQSQQREYQTELLLSIMGHLQSADALRLFWRTADNGSGRGTYTAVANGIFYFAQRVVDKLWQGMFSREPRLVFNFIAELISQAKQRSQGLSLDGLYGCLNRAVLYQLSRPRRWPAQQGVLQESLGQLLVHRNLLLGPGNYQPDFFACLLHCLLQIRMHRFVDGFGLEARSAWHVLSTSDPDDEEASQARAQLVKLVRRVWQELIGSKRAVVEVLCRSPLPPDTLSDPGRSDLASLRHLLEEPSTRAWQTYLGQERKQLSRAEQTVSSRLRVGSSGGFALTRLTGNRKQRKESAANRSTPSLQDASVWMFTHIAVVRDLVDYRYKQQQERECSVARLLAAEWGRLEAEVTRERGPWGPPVGSRLDKWMLDPTEGPCRMRRKLMPNEHFYAHYAHYPYPPGGSDRDDAQLMDEAEQNGQDVMRQSGKVRRVISYDSKEFYLRLVSQSSLEPVVATETAESEAARHEENGGEDGMVGVKGLVKPLQRSRSGVEPGAGLPGGDDEDGLPDPMADGAGIGDGGEKTENQTVLRLLAEGETISQMYRCARVEGLDTSEGLLLFGKEHFYVIDGVTMTTRREICDIDMLPPELQDPVIPRGTRSPPSHPQRACSKFSYEGVREVHKRRYLLQPMAVEVFSNDGRNYLLVFPRGVRNKVYQRFLTIAPSLADSSESVSGQNPNASVEAGSGLLSGLVGERSVTQRWVHGEISNFQYLMHLNTLAGRSYNDLMQYPVFPWILADYQSEELDLTDPRTFRDMSKPMGAQTMERLEQFQKRYQDWEDPNGETPAYHYGTHYSSAMIVASYLVRMEPFTQTFLRLQGGHFDLADRMFHSVRDAWLSASRNNMADVKELIPEFFYLPDFLQNSNHYNLGCKQNGIWLGEVLLPNWAKGDAREFIRVHREALECDYVSAHLHEWIDLIFGCKQQGPMAVASTNVFHHLFYEGQVDIYSITDPLKLTATIGFINNFGQIPKQLFKKPHPAKRVGSKPSGDTNPGASAGPARDCLFFHHLDCLTPSPVPLKELKGPVGQIVCTERGVLAVEENKVLLPPGFQRTFSWGFADLSCRLCNYDTDKAPVVFECMWEWGPLLCAVCPDAKTVVCGGTATVLCVWEMQGGGKDRKPTVGLKQVLYGHTDAVTCVAFSSAYHVLVSGSRDRTCIVWDLNKLCFVTQLRGHSGPIAAACVNELTGDIVSCSGTSLFVWSVNGEPLASASSASGPGQHVLCCAVSEVDEWDRRNVIVTGHSDGAIRMWRLEFQQVPETPVTQHIAHNSEGKLPVVPEINAEEGEDEEEEESSDSELDEPRASLSTDQNDPKRVTPNGPARPQVCSESDQLPRMANNRLNSDDGDGFVIVSYSDSESSDQAKERLLSHGQSNGGSGSHHNHHDAQDTSSPRQLKPGWRWERKLVLCGKLSMPGGAGNFIGGREGAEITALSVSRDHSRILVGDSRGRVYSCSTRELPGHG